MEERRVAHRRKWSSPERRVRLGSRQHPVIATIITTAVASAVVVGIAYAGANIDSILKGTPYEAAGWCSNNPVSFTLDLGALPPESHSRAIKDVKWAFDQWNSATGYTFAYSGEVSTDFNVAEQTITPSQTLDNNIYMDFAPVLDENPKIAGLAGPIELLPGRNEITSGFAVFKSDYFQSAPTYSTDTTMTLESFKKMCEVQPTITTDSIGE